MKGIWQFFFSQFFKTNYVALSHTLLVVLCIELQVTGLYLSQLAKYTSDGTQVAYMKRRAHLSQVLIRQLPSLQNKFSNSLAQAIPLAAWRIKWTGVWTTVPPFRRASRGQGCDVLSRETSCPDDVWAIPARWLAELGFPASVWLAPLLFHPPAVFTFFLHPCLDVGFPCFPSAGSSVMMGFYLSFLCFKRSTYFSQLVLLLFVSNYYFRRLKNIRRQLEIVCSKLQAASMGRDLSC